MEPIQSIQPLQKESASNYIGIGVFIGFIVALALVGGLYYKIRLDALSSLNAQKKAMPVAQNTDSTIIIITPQPTSIIIPTLAIGSIEELIAQQNALDTIDFTSLSAELDKNILDSADFAQ